MKQIKLTKGLYALVDDEVFGLLSNQNWSVSKAQSNLFYAANDKYGLMHRFIMGNPIGMEIDHINGNGLDNRKENLRICSHQQNMINRKMHKNNTSGFRGVYLDGNRWRAQIKVMGKMLRLGSFIKKEDAAVAYINAANIYFKEFMRKD